MKAQNADDDNTENDSYLRIEYMRQHSKYFGLLVKGIDNICTT
jgi:hypothetical protein